MPELLNLLMSAAGNDPRLKFPQMLLGGEAEEPVASPEPVGSGQSLLLSLADALQTYGRGFNQAIPPGTAQARLLGRRETQAQREATSQRQRQRREFMGRQSQARMGMAQTEAVWVFGVSRAALNGWATVTV